MNTTFRIERVELENPGEHIVVAHGPYVVRVGVFKDGEISASGHDYRDANFQLWEETVSAKRSERENHDMKLDSELLEHALTMLESAYMAQKEGTWKDNWLIDNTTLAEIRKKVKYNNE